MVTSADLEESLSEALSETKEQAAEMKSSEDAEALKKEIRRLNDRVRELEEANNAGKVLVEEDDYSDLTENDLKEEVDRLEISQSVSRADLEERMEDFRDEVFEEVFSAVENRLAEENFSDKVNSIRSDTDKRIESIEKELTEMQVEEKVDRDELEARIEEEREEIDNTVEFRYNELTSELNDVRKNMEALRSNVSEVHDRLGKLREEIERVESETRRVETELESEIERSKEEVVDEIEPVPSQDDFESLKSKVAELSSVLEDVSEKLAGR